jgi:hypothetical protein
VIRPVLISSTSRMDPNSAPLAVQSWQALF